MEKSPKPTSTLSLLTIARQRHRSGDIAGAEVIYRQILDTQPGNLQALFHLGTAYQQRGLFKESIELLAKAVQLKPDFVPTLNALGVSLARDHQYEAAADAFQRALDQRPDLPDLHINLGNLRKSQEKFDLAVACYQAALRVNPAHAEAHNRAPST